MAKKSLDDWLNEVDYSYLNSDKYVPSEFALTFMNFIKLVNGEQGESNKTPPVHLAMMDKLASPERYIANLCHRGLGKTTVFAEYLVLYVAVFGSIPYLPNIDGIIYVAATMEGGAKDLRKNIEFRYEQSDFLKSWLPKVHFTDAYMEFKNKENKVLGVKSYGAQALPLDTCLYTCSGTTTIGDVQIGDTILGADGKPTTVTNKSGVFNKPTYKITLKDGRELITCEDHLNQVWIKHWPKKTAIPSSIDERTLSTKELLNLDLFKTDLNGNSRPLIWIENIKPLEFNFNNNLLIDPYTVGLLLGDGSLNLKQKSNTIPVVLTAHKDDWDVYENIIPYSLGEAQIDKRNNNIINRTIIGIGGLLYSEDLCKKGNYKTIPNKYLYCSIEQRLELLQGLMDSDGSAYIGGRCCFSSNSLKLVEQVMWLVRSLGGYSYLTKTGKKSHYRCIVWLNMPLFKLPRKVEKQKKPKLNMQPIISIEEIETVPTQCISVDNIDKQYVASNNLIRTHNTGIRGSKIYGKRPQLAILDDLLSDDDAKSEVVMNAIKDTIYKGVFHALDPVKKKIIFNGTPFHSQDILVEAVESGGWNVNVWPVCEVWPVDDKDDFRGSWEDRFTYEAVKDAYDLSVSTGKESAFNQELMLRLSSTDDRMIQDEEIRWYKKADLLSRKNTYNFYVTSDFATTNKTSSDDTVIAVWAYNANGDWFLVDGICGKQLMDKTFDDLFRLVQMYKPQSVGIETSGQQGGFVTLLQKEQMTRNIWFNFASNRTGNLPGINSAKDKLTRLNQVVPWFKTGKIYFPEEDRKSKWIGQYLSEIRLVTKTAIKGKDNCLDTVSMLAQLTAWKPSEETPLKQNEDGVWESDEVEVEESCLTNYIV